MSGDSDVIIVDADKSADPADTIGAKEKEEADVENVADCCTVSF